MRLIIYITRKSASSQVRIVFPLIQKCFLTHGLTCGQTAPNSLLDVQIIIIKIVFNLMIYL